MSKNKKQLCLNSLQAFILIMWALLNFCESSQLKKNLSRKAIFFPVKGIQLTLLFRVKGKRAVVKHMKSDLLNGGD